MSPYRINLPAARNLAVMALSSVFFSRQQTSFQQISELAMFNAHQIEGAWIAKIDGRLFFLNLGNTVFGLIFELPAGTSLSMGEYDVDLRASPAQLNLRLTDGIGKNGDRLRGRQTANLVEAIVQVDGDTLEFFGPPPELGGRPVAFPSAPPGLVGQHLYLQLKRIA
jgi:hypothetical protein